MKKLFVLLLVVTVLLAQCAYAEDAPETLISGDYSYILPDDGTAAITGYNGPDTELTLPGTLDGYTVSDIGDGAFAGKGVTKVTIPDGVTGIGVYAFLNTVLTEVVIPDGVTFIGEGAFSWCFDLTSVTLPASIPGLDLNIVFQDVVNAIEFTVPAGSDCEKLCEEAGVHYASVEAGN